MIAKFIYIYKYLINLIHMIKNKAKLKFLPSNFEIIEKGEFVICAVSGKKIPLNSLTYWNVELQEAYFSPLEAQKRYEELNKK
tara:strand:- start:94 stop:342 length:249 start_codon:yes stop_codon:yes gene_type:complete